MITKSFYGLPRHQWMRIRFDFIAVDDWRNDTLFLEVDGNCNYEETSVRQVIPLQNQSFDNSRLSVDMCSNTSYSDAPAIMNVSFSHNTSMVKLRIKTSYYNQSGSNAHMFWGFKNLLIVVGQCAPNCLTCTSSSPTDCLSCATNYLLNSRGSCVCDTTKNNYYLTHCLPKCETDKRAVMYNQSCVECQYLMPNCLRCSSYNTCVECINGAYLNAAGQCVVRCEIGHYNEQETKSCKDCPVNCKGCSKDDECYQCNDTYSEHWGRCYSSCPTRTFWRIDSDGNKRCHRCSRDCLTCTDESTCTKCNDQLKFYFILTNGYCSLPCGVTTYRSKYSRKTYNISYNSTACSNITCNSSCATCFGTASYNCLSCNVVNGTYQVLNDYMCSNSCPSGKFNNSGYC